jgi:hypothetical protein
MKKEEIKSIIRKKINNREDKLIARRSIVRKIHNGEIELIIKKLN